MEPISLLSSGVPRQLGCRHKRSLVPPVKAMRKEGGVPQLLGPLVSKHLLHQLAAVHGSWVKHDEFEAKVSVCTVVCTRFDLRRRPPSTYYLCYDFCGQLS